MTNHSTMKLGRAGVVHLPARRRMAELMAAKLPAPLDAVDNTGGVTGWGMMLNDRLGCCTVAGLAHSLQVVTRNAQTTMLTPSDGIVLAGYESLCGYVPAQPATDLGGVETSILMQVGIDGFAGQVLSGWASPDPADLQAVKQCISLFGCVYMGAELPMSAQNQDVWQTVRGDGDGGVWGGHCMVAVAYDPQYVTFITWGQLKRATWAWWLRYVDEAHALLWQVGLQAFPASTSTELLDVLRDETT